MPRKPRLCPAGYPVHVIQRGINRQVCFTGDADTAAYAHWLAEGAEKFDVLIHGWVFMTNHVHLLLTPLQDHAISHLMQWLGRLYVRRFNFRYARTGGLFEGRFKASLIQDEVYLLTCLIYIELNPVRAGMVTSPGDYRWSSYAAHGSGVAIPMLTKHELYLDLGTTDRARQKAYRQRIQEKIGFEAIPRIRHCANRDQILGSELFQAKFERVTDEQHRDQES